MTAGHFALGPTFMKTILALAIPSAWNGPQAKIKCMRQFLSDHCKVPTAAAEEFERGANMAINLRERLCDGQYTVVVLHVRTHWARMLIGQLRLQ